MESERSRSALSTRTWPHRKFTHVTHATSFVLRSVIVRVPTFFLLYQLLWYLPSMCTLFSVFCVMYVWFTSMLSTLFFSIHIIPIFLQILNKIFLFYTYIVLMSVCCLPVLQLCRQFSCRYFKGFHSSHVLFALFFTLSLKHTDSTHTNTQSRAHLPVYR